MPDQNDSEEKSLSESQAQPADPVADENAVIVSDDAQDDTESSLSSFRIVAIGASAGGVEAYIELFKNLPPNTGMAYVVIPHLSAGSKSFLPEIVSRYNTMETLVIEDGVRPQPDRIYFLPPNAQATIKGGRFHLVQRENDGSPRPIDVFFRSLASDQGNRAVGVVLSGMDSDGALGLRSIKGEGGIAMVQSPESARFPDMPRSSISAEHVDIVLPPGQIAFELAQLSRQFQHADVRLLEDGAPPGDERQFNRILSLLKGVSGIDFRMYKPSTVRRRIARRMLLHRIGTLADYGTYLQENPKELRDLQEDALINVTRFFRDPEVFEALKTVVLPQIFQDRTPDQQVRIWVAGCSSGEEAYSIAMLLLEHLTGNPLEPPIQIYGTDASEHNIQTARAAIYPETISGEVSPERLRRFFIRTEKGYQVAKRVRDLCIFARQNLCHDPPFSRMDLISCRNVMIYFGPSLQKQLISTFHYALRPKGFLILGNSEAIREFTDIFAQIDRRNKIFTRIGSDSTRRLADVVPRLFHPEHGPAAAAWPALDTRADAELTRAADRIVLSRFGPPGVLVDEKGEIVQSRGQTSPFFEMPQGAVTHQLARLLRESIAPHITAALRRSTEENMPVQVAGLRIRERDHVRDITVEVFPVIFPHSRSRYFLVLFVPANEPHLMPPPAPADPPALIAPEQKDLIISQMRQDLASTKIYLQSLLEERDTRNQELVSANEEIQSANEELQSTNEELETTKEELQSSNEELQTVNDELQNRNTVLTQASNDLSNLLNSVNLPVLMLNNDLTIRHFTPPAQRLMNLRPSDVERPFGEIRLNLNVDDLAPLFVEVLETLAAHEMEVQDREGHWYLLRIRPYRTTDNKIEGLVVVLVDIDQLRRSQQELKDARDFATSVMESTPLPLVVLDLDFKIRTANEAFCRLADVPKIQLEHRFFPDLAIAFWGLEPMQARLAQLAAGVLAKPSFNFEHRTSDPRARTFLIQGCLLHPEDKPFILVTMEDITSHKEVERLLKAESERLTSQVESTTEELDRSQHELRALAGSLFTAQEEERRHIARELHDDISQRLARLDIDSHAIAERIDSDPASAKQKLIQLRSELASLAGDVRGFSHRLHPSLLEDLGLELAIRSLVEEFTVREEMIATFSGSEIPKGIPLDIATGIYRIAQEALHNIAKHAGRTHIKVNLGYSAGVIQLQVADSGIGFDPLDKRTGLGLISMEERARLMGGTFQIDSGLGLGTQVRVDVPLPVSSGPNE